MTNETVIIDLSHWNPEPNWTALREGGVVGVILKATEGTDYRDDTFSDRFTGATAAGLGVATYHFLRKGDIVAQMENYLDYVRPDPGDRLCLDHEEASDGTNASLDELIEAVQYLREHMPKCELSIYGGSVLKTQIGGEYIGTLAANTSLWIAHHTSAAAPTWPKNTWPTWSLWQFSDQAVVLGAADPLDGNRFNGTKENALKWIGPATVQPTPVPVPPVGGNLAVVSIQTSPGIDLMLVVNGKVIEPPRQTTDGGAPSS